jgi:hypothetical protein
MKRLNVLLILTSFVIGCGADTTSVLDGEDPTNALSTAWQLLSSDNPFVYWEDESTVVVYPMNPDDTPGADGGAFSDVINVQYAVDALPAGGTVILSATDLDGIPSAFEFGAPVWVTQDAQGNSYDVVTSMDPGFGVSLSRDVTILGETAGTKITRGSNVFWPSDEAIATPITVVVEDVEFYLSSRALFSTGAGGFGHVTVKDCRFENVLDGISLRSYDRLEVTDSEFHRFWRIGIFANARLNNGAITIASDNVMTSGPQVLNVSWRVGIWLDSYYGSEPSISARLGDTVIEDNIIHMTGADILTWGMGVELLGLTPVPGSDLRIQDNVVTLEGEGDFEAPRMFGIDLFGAAVGFLVEDNEVYGKMRMGLRAISPYSYTPVPAEYPSLPADNTFRDNYVEGRFVHDNPQRPWGSGIWVGGSYNSFIENTVNSAEGSQSAVFIWPMASVGGNFISGVGSDNIFRENTITGTAGYGFKIESGDSNILSDNDLASFAAGVAHIYLDEFSEDNCIDGVEGLTVIPAEPVNGNVYYDASGGC